MPSYSRYFFAVLVSLFAFVLAGGVNAQPWQSADPASAGWSMEKLAAAQDYASSLKPTAVMVVQNGKVIASWGDVSRKVNVGLARKKWRDFLIVLTTTGGSHDQTRTTCIYGIIQT